MSETQSYKTARICCNQHCRQGRDCPNDTEYSLVNIAVMFAGAFMLGAPFVAWAWSL
jgi:hypothetical protein